MVDIGRTCTCSESYDISLFKFPSKGTHMIHGINHRIKLNNLTFVVNQAVIREKFCLLSKVNFYGNFLT